MKYLLDTCVVSELVEPNPSGKVIEWIDAQDEEQFYLSVLTIGEIEKGVQKLTESRRKEQISEWLHDDLLLRFRGQILPIDQQTAMLWGKLIAEQGSAGRKLPAVDSLITATALQYDLVLVTRNVDDFSEVGIQIYNPWK